VHAPVRMVSHPNNWRISTKFDTNIRHRRPLFRFVATNNGQLEVGAWNLARK